MSFLSRHYSRALASGALMVGLFLSSCSAPPDGDSAADSAGANAGDGTATAAAANSGDSPRKPQPTLAPTCNNPHLDLLETEYGLWGSKLTLFTTTEGKEDSYWEEPTVIDNHFDPCADYSYVVVKVKPPESVGSQLRPRDMVLFFAGEHLIREQKMPAITEVRNVEISGSEAKVDYHNVPFTFTDQAFDYQMTYKLAPHKVEEQGINQPEDWRQIMRSDFSRTPLGSDFNVMAKFGNVSYKPYDYEEDWAGSYVTIPIAGTTMRCALMGQAEGVVTSVECLAQQPIFPPVEGQPPVESSDLDPQSPPVDGKYFVAEMDFTMPVRVVTSNRNLGNARSYLEMQDEAITKVGGITFDTHGDSVVISDNEWTFTLSPEAVTKEKAQEVDTSRWPKE